ncbi:uncharacterized protein RCO7_07456 [Rhynchosporium graminicola]|uniref:XRCC4 coiled-coil domain-containing protein n=1 Tax=Rhynchosporium graminicola TaxID=2792576 RepID=A0A1E1LMZ2_9HELO|nr:uncharacterized protein RCO7_07456 [Rhynchosporium commune]
MDPILIKVPRPDHGADSDFVLLHVASAGGKLLDLNLIGTENDNIYTFSCKRPQIGRRGPALGLDLPRGALIRKLIKFRDVLVKQNQTHKLKDKKVTQEEWETTLSAFLLGTDPQGEPVDAPEGLEAVASLQPGPGDVPKSITVQKLGSIVLPTDPDGDGDLYEWCSENVVANRKLTQKLQASKAKLLDKDAQIKRLEESLAELVKAKNDNDTQLLEKFSLLLNEKKLKIRDQQRLLQSSNVDPAQLKELEEAGTRSRSRSAGPSRTGKRKVIEVEEEDFKDGVDKMDVDDEATAKDSDQEPARDSGEETADERTASEASEDEEPPVPLSKRKTEAKTKQEPSSSQASSSRTLQDQPEPPQKRELPFSKKSPAKTAAPADEGSATESDDEL